VFPLTQDTKLNSSLMNWSTIDSFFGCVSTLPVFLTNTRTDKSTMYTSTHIIIVRTMTTFLDQVPGQKSVIGGMALRFNLPGDAWKLSANAINSAGK
jgi:hypothetical protein